ncbi:MAG TPA: EF-Tu/IF-2/RF-3 family GTPase [Gemmatimonadales bacterium]|nr:EF-Tu/IF-2/RF-3 family GTPase [Gemmatimonadales bacterium]
MSFPGEHVPEQQIGTVTHYFGGPGVAVVKIEAGELAVGDKVRFVGHTTDFTETVTSMEVEHQKVDRAKTGDEVAVKVLGRVRIHDKVMRVD